MQDQLLKKTRRQLFRDCGVGVGKVALASLIQETMLAKRHHAAKIENVILCQMCGAPSHLELFEYKPELVKWDGKTAPDSLLAGKRFAFMDSSHGTKLLGTKPETDTRLQNPRNVASPAARSCARPVRSSSAGSPRPAPSGCPSSRRPGR